MPYSSHAAPPPAPSERAAPAAAFAPLPLRARGILENVDTSFKLFKQYWRPLLAWAALTNVLMVLASYFSLLVGPPFIIGPTCCVLAAAVRGQDVGFKECWGFSKGRIWNLLAVYVLSMLAAAIAVGVLGLGIGLLCARVLEAVGDSFWLQAVIVVVGILAASLLLGVAMAWQGMVAMVACMEDDFRNAGALKRAATLLRGRWKAAIALLTLLNMALLVLYGVLCGVFGMVMGLDGLSRAVEGGGGGLAFLGAAGAILVSSWLLFTLFMPIMYLSQALFYLDARVRHEALDLEWNAHRATEIHGPHAAPLPHNGPPGAVEAAPQSFFARVEAPSAASTWAPAQSSPGQAELPKPALQRDAAPSDATERSEPSPFSPR